MGNITGVNVNSETYDLEDTENRENLSSLISVLSGQNGLTMTNSRATVSYSGSTYATKTITMPAKSFVIVRFRVGYLAGVSSVTQLMLTDASGNTLDNTKIDGWGSRNLIYFNNESSSEIPLYLGYRIYSGDTSTARSATIDTMIFKFNSISTS